MIKRILIPEITEKDEKRFWNKAKVSNSIDECWDWQKGKNIGGYGTFDLRGKTFMAHRVAFYLANSIDPKDLCVCHKCDNPACVNHNHLFLGTDQDNVDDRDKKGRHVVRVGEDSNSKLKEYEVIQIRELHLNGGSSVKDLSKKYNVSTSVIHDVLTKKTWKHITPNYEKRKVEKGNRKLNKDNVLEIRDRFMNGKNTMLELADMFNVTNVSVFNVVKMKTWRNIQTA